MASEHSSERVMCLSLQQKLEMIKLREEGMSKARYAKDCQSSSTGKNTMLPTKSCTSHAEQPSYECKEKVLRRN
jgi:hypothetical protein